MRMQAALLTLLVWIVPGGAQEQRVLLGRGNTLSGWTFGSPGGNSSLTLSINNTVPWSGLAYLNVTYDFTPGGWQAVISPEDGSTLDIPEASALCFSVFRPGPDGESMLVQLLDATGASRGSWPYLTAPGWNNLTLSFNSSDWLPRANGTQIPLPLKGLSIGAGKGNEHGLVGWLGIADVYLLTTAPPGGVPHPVVMDLVQPPGIGDGVVVGGGAPGLPPTLLGVEVVNRLQVDCPVNITVTLRNSTGPMGEGEWATCTQTTLLGPWEATTLACSIPSDAPPGYLVMRALFTSSACWSPNDTAVALEGSLAIVPPQPAYTPVARNKHAAVFGGQMESSAVAAAAIGMWTVRSGPLWEWSQPGECWDPLKCFDWTFYDGILRLAEAGIEVMIDARELAPPWASAKNGSGPTWASIPGPAHYPDYVRWLGLMLDRYGGSATAVEVSNEDDGLAFFMPYAIPYEYAVNLSLALINLTLAGIAAASNPAAVAGLQLVGLSSSSFDVKQTGNGGTQYMQYERAVLGAPGVIGALHAVSLHPYQNHVWVPWTNPGWGNFSFQFFNESAGWGTNSTTAQLLATAALMREVAAATPGMPPDYKPVLRPSEWGYNLIMNVALSEGWALMHAALVAQGMVHFRSAPLSEYVDKAFYFAACDSCCAESNGFFGLWRGAQQRTGPNATSPAQWPSRILSTLVPLPSVSAHAVASVLLDVPSGRLAGQWVIDHSVDGGVASPGSSSQQLPPSCVAFAPDPASPLNPPPLIVLFILGHHFNDRTTATLALGAPPARVVSGLGAELPAQPTAVVVEGGGGGVTIPLSLAALPTYVELAQGTDPVAACEGLTWA